MGLRETVERLVSPKMLNSKVFDRFIVLIHALFLVLYHCAGAKGVRGEDGPQVRGVSLARLRELWSEETFSSQGPPGQAGQKGPLGPVIYSCSLSI